MAESHEYFHLSVSVIKRVENRSHLREKKPTNQQLCIGELIASEWGEVVLRITLGKVTMAVLKC